MTERTSGPTWSGFFAWVLVGVVFGVGTLTLTILMLVPVAIMVVVLVVRPALARSGFGLVTGVGVLALYVAFVQRRCPGTVCWQTANASGCDEYLNPWPWLVIGVVLVCVGVVAQVRRMRRARDAPPTDTLAGVDPLPR